MQVRRGEIYWVLNQNAFGHEMNDTRPAVVVSRDENNERNQCVTVVYLTTRLDRPECCTHVMVRSAEKPSLALCEHIYTVDKERLGTFAGSCTKQEIKRITAALDIALDIAVADLQVPNFNDSDEAVKLHSELAETQNRLLQANLELGMLRSMYDTLLDKLMVK